MSRITTGRRIDRRNRFRFFLLGLVALALGLAGLLVQDGLLRADQPSSLYSQARELAQDYPEWTYGLLVLGGLLLFLYGLALIRKQIATPTTRLRDVLVSREANGSTTVDADALGHVLARDLERLPDIQDASARLVGVGPRPRAVVRATVNGSADIPRLRSQMEDAFERLRTALGSEGIETDVHLKPIPTRRARVS